MVFRRQISDHKPLYFNVISLVDILMVLVIFLIANWSAGRIESELLVDLPKSSTAPKRSSIQAPIILNIKSDGGILINNRLLSDEKTAAILAEMVKLSPEQTVVLRADKNVGYDRILAVLDICNRVGVGKVGFGALPL